MSALDKQVGGDHYKTKAMQPVELWAALDLNGFQASIVKYITRHEEKNGAADIDKAEHFFALMVELQPVRWWHKLTTLNDIFSPRIRQRKVVKHITRYADENGLTGSEQFAIRCALLPAFNTDRAVTSGLFRHYIANIRTDNGYV